MKEAADSFSAPPQVHPQTLSDAERAEWFGARLLSEVDRATTLNELVTMTAEALVGMFSPRVVAVAAAQSGENDNVIVQSYIADSDDSAALNELICTILKSGMQSVPSSVLNSIASLREVPASIALSAPAEEVRLFLLISMSDGVPQIPVTLQTLERIIRLKAENIYWRKTVSDRLANLSGLHKSTQEIRNKLFSMEELLQTISREAADVLNVTAAAILVPIDETKTAFTLKARSGFPSDELPLPNVMFAKAFEDFESNGRRPVLYQGNQNDKYFLVPLIQRNESIGILFIYSNDPNFSITPDREQIAEIFGDWVSIAIENAFMFERVSNSQKEWENTFDSIGDPIYIVDNEYRLKKINRSLAGYAMRSLKLPLMRNCYRYLFHRSSICPWCPVPKNAETGQPVVVEASLFSGGVWQIQSFPYTDQQDKRIGSINVLRDVTVLKRMQEQLIESEKMASTGKLISGVAHEVRNPLFGISATVRALANELGNKQNLKPFLDVISSETGRLNRLMEDLLNYSRPVRIDKNPSDMSAIVKEVIADFRHSPETQNASIDFVTSEWIPPINVDSNKIKQVLFNLVENGIQHSPDIPQINIFLEFLSLADPPEIHLVIKDKGSGIPEQNLTRVFDPFFTTRKKGTGLGLSIVRKVIHDHGGRISIESHPGLGTSFRITLPVVSSPS